MRNVRVQFMVMMLLLCGAAGIMVGFAGVTESHRDGGNVPHPMEASAASGRLAIEAFGGLEAGEANESDLALLAALGLEHMESSALLTVKIQGELISSLSNDQAKTAAQQLAHTIGLSGVTASQLQGNEVFQAEGKLSEISVQFNWAISKRGNSYVRVMLVGEAARNTGEMTSLRESIQKQMEEAGIANTWNASIQGYASTSTDVQATMTEVEESAAQMLSLRMVEKYEDVGTLSRSYEAPSLGTFVKSGNTPIHMQMAVHEDSVKKRSRITIGFPVITIEY
ncbi:YwmB family TATA-box binding protein [Paenibacillus solani]|uniref:YwmB family TATA-box binding protein n=1 Tax=Paenibacillus solani TaxID=1705565 RepID=UPI003D2BC731